MMRALVLGAGGMAGHVVTQYLREKGYDVDTLSGSKRFDDTTALVNVKDTEKLKTALNTRKYDVVINCIALLVKESEEDKVSATQVNSVLPLFLEHHYANSTTKIIHISTDGVFSGKNQPYAEDSIRDGLSFYGRSKALGELDNHKDLTLRLSITGPCFSPDGSGLFHWAMQQSGEIQGYTNVMWSGITTIELAKCIDTSIKQGTNGILHLIPPEAISKFDLLELFKKTFGLTGVSIQPTKGDLVGTVLESDRLIDFNHKIPDYETMVRQMKEWIDSHPEMYKHYAR